jgi:hypothetical protein
MVFPALGPFDGSLVLCSVYGLVLCVAFDTLWLGLGEGG